MSMVEPRVAGPAVILASTWLVSGSAAIPDLVGLVPVLVFGYLLGHK